jgi:heme/copper-type cytochrome/quinol oxidase subunit 2
MNLHRAYSLYAALNRTWVPDNTLQKKQRARSFRIAIVVFVIVIFFFAVVFLFVFFLIRLLPKANRGGYREIRAIWSETVWQYGDHV